MGYCVELFYIWNQLHIYDIQYYNEFVLILDETPSYRMFVSLSVEPIVIFSRIGVLMNTVSVWHTNP